MATAHDIHNDLESWLAAAVHDQLSPDERAQFNEHLASCEACRALYEEELTMSKMIEATLEEAKPDLAFEQRVVSRFRKSVPPRSGLMSTLANLMRMRATQIAAVAALLLGLVQVGRMVTGENRARSGDYLTQVTSSRIDASRPSENDDAARNASYKAKKPATAPAPPMQAFADAQNAGAIGRSAAAPAMRKPDAQKAAAADAMQAASDEIAQPSQAGGKTERVIVTGSYIPTAPAEESLPAAVDSAAATQQQGSSASAQQSSETKGEAAEFVEGQQESPPSGADANRKLVRNAQVEIEVIKFDDAAQKITAFATEDKGYVATSSSERQANGKLRGEVVVKVLPDRLDGFLLKLRGLGEVKNQTLGTEDVTKQYFDTDARLKNARVIEQRLIELLKTKSTKVADLLEVEKELGRVREQIEQMQGELKYMDAQVAFATVTITLAEKDMDVPAAFLLKRRATLALFSNDVEKTFAEVKGVIDGTKAQISSSTLDRDSAGEATARLTLLIVPEEADALIDRIKGMGRVQNYNEQADRIAQGGDGMSDTAKVKRDKVQLSVTISRQEQEPALQTTSLNILTSGVTDKVAKLKESAARTGAEVRSSSFNHTADGMEYADLSLRVPMKNYNALISSFDQLGKVKDVNIHRDDRRGVINEETAPADVHVRVYSQPNIISDESGLFATIRRTLGQGAAALMWSLRKIGVAIAFFAPWVLALAVVIWIVKRISRARAARRGDN